MHRTYSLRHNRAPTASQMQNPPPPTSSTKSGKFFGKGSLGNTFKRTAASSFGPDAARKISQLVKTEKSVMRAMEMLSLERRTAAKALTMWGEEQENDVSDITDRLSVLIYEMGMIDDAFIDRYDQYRLAMKQIRNIEASIQPSRSKKQSITDQIAQLKYKDPQSPKIAVLEQELVRAEAECLVAEAQLSNITREKVKQGFNYQFDAIKEHAEKIAICASYGKALLQLLDDSTVTPGETRHDYDGYDTSKQIIIDCEGALRNWTLDWGESPVGQTYSLRNGEEGLSDQESDLAHDEIHDAQEHN